MHCTSPSMWGYVCVLGRTQSKHFYFPVLGRNVTSGFAEYGQNTIPSF